MSSSMVGSEVVEESGEKMSKKEAKKRAAKLEKRAAKLEKRAAELDKLLRKQEGEEATSSSLSVEEDYGDVAPNELTDGGIMSSSMVEKMSKEEAKKPTAKLEKRVAELEKRVAELEELLRKQEGEEAKESFSSDYGDVAPNELQSAAGSSWRELTDVSNLVEEIVGSEVSIRGRVHKKRFFPDKLFIILRECGFTVQCVVKETSVGANMIKFVNQLSLESVVELIGVVSPPKQPLIATTQQVEIHVRKMYCLSRSLPKLPFVVENAALSEADIQKTLKDGKPAPRVLQDTRLNNRVLDMRTPANQAIFRIQCQVQIAFREFLQSKGFLEIHTPKLMAGTSEGGSAVFRLDYKGQPACLAQSPQLHKQMAICGDMRRVFEVGPVFRAEDSFTHRHLCEFVGLDVEMEIRTHYSEIMDLVGDLFPFIFTKIEERCPKEVEAVRKQYPFQSLKFLPQTLRLTFAQGIQMLKEAGEEVDPLGDLNTESERKLGQLVLEKYKTEFYMLHRYPSAVRPFYTMPCEDDSNYSNSFDVFIRGEEIMSGAQRIHDPQLLEKRARECGIDVKTISTYIDAFRYGVPPHGGFGVGLERVVMLLCALNNIRKTSLFPRDPQRLAP
uniref:aspartate--tRNA ligase n=1 Tax=Noccaea caerulescens TaxID=107243 RepID=A0A1J3DEG5_NOCCA